MLSVLLLLAAAPRTFDWAAATTEFPKLSEFTPVPAASAAPLFVKLGGCCYSAVGDGTLKLGEGARDGHFWRWSGALRTHGIDVVLEGPVVTHGFDRPGDTRLFAKPERTKRLVLGPAKGDVVPLYEKSYRLEIACWGVDESTATCDGKQVRCARCSVLRLMGGPIGGQRVYGDGVIRADFTKDCAHQCDGPGLIWSDYEALAAFVARTNVVHTPDAVAGELYRTRAACDAGGSDLAPDFKGGEPAIPP